MRRLVVLLGVTVTIVLGQAAGTSLAGRAAVARAALTGALPHAFVDALENAPRPAPTPAPAPPLDQVVNAALAGQPGTFGIAVRNLSTGETWLLNGDQFFPSASLYKLAVMYEVFRQQNAHVLALDEVLTIQPSQMEEATDEEPLAVGDQVSIQTALELMIAVSSNVAGHALADRVGWEQVNTSLAALGLNHTRLPVGAWKAQMTDWRSSESSTSPGDMLAFFQRLYDHQLVSPSASEQMLHLLLAQQVNDRIPANLPGEIAVAHKTGNLDGVVNDAGLVYGPRATFIVVFLSQDVAEGLATTTEARLARLLFDRFNAPAP